MTHLIHDQDVIHKMFSRLALDRWQVDATSIFMDSDEDPDRDLVETVSNSEPLSALPPTNADREAQSDHVQQQGRRHVCQSYYQTDPRTRLRTWLRPNSRKIR